ncbi:MAG: ATP-binding domain-containing protein, partial [Lachnospiraceae bacterium]|nr:ATP-binding domain-containing protein [Lachnospiraceae bacterium]
ISEAHHVVIDEAQDFGMMAYCVLKFCIKDCTYTIMGDISQNIHFGYGLNDWEELKMLLLTNETDSFGVLKKSYRNTVEISEFATNILHHGQFSIYPVEPIIRHGRAVGLLEIKDREILWQNAAEVCQNWQEKGLDTIAVICRNSESARTAAAELGKYVNVIESDLEKAVFGSGIMVLPVEYTKGLEFDAVLILNPTREEYPVDDGHAKLLYVAATRALHELCVLHSGDITGLIADLLPDRVSGKTHDNALSMSQKQNRTVNPERKIQNKQNNTSNTSGTAISTRKKISASYHTTKKELVKSPVEQQKPVSVTKPAEKKISEMLFGDMPATGMLCPAGHSKIDLAVRWVIKQSDGLYFHCRYVLLSL